MHDDLGNRMKEYEKAGQRYLTRRTPVILRIDGCHFHTFTRGFQKPFDDVLIKTMQQTTKYLCENIQGCVFGYTQSDEITLVLVDYKKLTSSAWFDNRQNKIESVAASMATMIFNKLFIDNYLDYIISRPLETDEDKETYQKLGTIYENAANKGAYFDCRVFNIPVDDVTNNKIVDWEIVDENFYGVIVVDRNTDILYYWSASSSGGITPIYKKSKNKKRSNIWRVEICATYVINFLATHSIQMLTSLMALVFANSVASL